jgi:hypothetical protein
LEDIDDSWSTVLPGEIFTVSASGVPYFIAATESPSTSTSGFWELSLSAPYGGETGVGLAYVICRDFTVFAGLPLLYRGDAESALIYSRAMTMLDAMFQDRNSAAFSDWFNGVSYNVGDITRGSDGNIYAAISGGVGTDPTTDNGDTFNLLFVKSDVTLNIPSRFATFAAAWAFIKNARIDPSATVTLQFANGTYLMTAGATNGLYNLNHPDGAQIQILGDIAGTIGNVTLSWAANTYDWATEGLTYATDHMGAFYVNHGHVMPYLNGFKLIGPGRAKKYYGLQAYGGSLLRTGPKMWVTDFYSNLALFFKSNGNCDFFRASNGGDGSIFLYDGCSLSFRGGIAEGAGAYFAMAGICMEFGSHLFAPDADFRLNAGFQLTMHYECSAMLDGARFESGGAFNSAPAIRMQGVCSFQFGGGTLVNCDLNNIPRINFNGNQIIFGPITGYENLFGNASFTFNGSNVSMSICSNGIGAIFTGFPGTANIAAIATDGPAMIHKVGSSNTFTGTQVSYFSAAGNAFKAPNAQLTDADIPAGFMHAWLDESGNNLKFRVRYAGGTYKTATVALV